MTTEQILQHTGHRPWPLPLPEAPWSFYQEWNDVLFLHWQVDEVLLRQLIPEELEVELFAGQAWVSIVVFTMERARPKALPAFAPISNFHEVNIRTYVRHQRKAGVYFLSIEAGRSLPALIARSISELPYRKSEIKRERGCLESRNTKNKEYLNIAYSTGAPISSKAVLDKWLTERYALFQETSNAINAFDIHHIEWPLQKLEIQEFELSYPHLDQLFTSAPDLAHYSAGIQVLAWNKQKSPRQT